MDSLINSLRMLFSTYGLRAATIIMVSVLLVNLVKKPIVKYGEKLMEKRGLDKSVATRYVSFLPFAFTVLLNVLWACFSQGFRVIEIDWSEVLSSGLIYGAVAIATYETVKKHLQAYAAKVNSSELSATEMVKKLLIAVGDAKSAQAIADGIELINSTTEQNEASSDEADLPKDEAVAETPQEVAVSEESRVQAETEDVTVSVGAESAKVETEPTATTVSAVYTAPEVTTVTAAYTASEAPMATAVEMTPEAIVVPTVETASAITEADGQERVDAETREAIERQLNNLY